MSLQSKIPTPLRRRLSTRKCGGGIAVCCVALLSVLFFMVGMQDKQPRAKSKLESRPTGSPDSSRTGGPESNANSPTPGNVDGMEHPQENGLRRYPSFEEYVRARRAEDPDSFMPVVEEKKENVTVPELIVIGARRAGTTSLFRMIGQHPDVASIVPEVYTKDSLGFMAQDPATYPKEAEWAGDKLETELPASVVGNLLREYSRPFILAESREKGIKNQLLTVELSSGYLASPLAPYRLKIAMPDVKVVILLRDPVERYFSELREKLCDNAERDIDWDGIKASFADISASKAYLSEAVVNFSPYDKRCLGELASPSDLWKCKQGAERSHRPLLEGLYAVQIARWLRVFDSSQIKIVDSKKLFSEPDKTAADVAKFAGLRDHTFVDFALDREASCDPRRRSLQVSSAYYKRKEAEPKFRKWYAEHNDMLAELIGEDFGWNDRIRSMNTEPSGGFLRA